jgi:hypothetical protein
MGKLIELSTLKEEGALNLGTETKYDTILNALIESVSAEFEDLTGWGVWQEARTEYFDSTNNLRRIRLRGWPVDSGTDVDIFYDSTWTFDSDSELSETYYDVDYNTGWIYFSDSTFMSGHQPRALKITYKGGGAVETSPDSGEEFWTLYPDAARGIMEEVVHRYKLLPNINRSTVWVQNMRAESERPLGHTPAYKQAIAKYRRVLV